ncbi:MAG: hypothetical protein IIB35_04815 [Gemmatimonadetes bacterium]|nr:hypothetical protein [Gemmatimonadota bacterium]
MRIAFIVVAVGLTTAVVPVAASATQTDTLAVAGHQSAPGGQQAIPQSLSPLQISGTYLGLFDALEQDERAATDPVRSQFEFAINIDLEWQLSPRVRGFANLQSGTGGGVFGFQGPALNVTDLNLVFDADVSGPVEALSLTIGSFDTPFGEETAFLTNNGNSFGSPFVINSLFYGVFWGTVGTLNTLGAMGTIETSVADLTVALTNGTDESAVNADGNYQIVVSLGTDYGLSGLRTAVSFIRTDDSDRSGSTGFGADLTGVMLDFRVEIADHVTAKGYFSRLSFGDEDPATEDDLSTWMGELRVGKGGWHAAARLSGWTPDDSDGGGSGMSAVLPSSGLAVRLGGISPVLDQAIRRIQAGVGRAIRDNLVIKGEWFFDDYRRLSAGRSTDVIGVIVSLNGRF